MNSTSFDPEYEECCPAAKIRVLWAASAPSNLNALNALHVGLGCLHLAEKRTSTTNIVEPLTGDVLTAIADAHLLFVVHDFESEALAEQIDQACRRSNRNAPFRIRSHDNTEAICIAIRSMTEMLNVYSFIGIDIEDVRFALDGPGFIKISTAVAYGQDRAHIAATQALVDTNLSVFGVPTIRGVLLIISAAPRKIHVSECNLISRLLRERLSADAESAYGMNYDATLGEAIRVTIFAR